MTTTTTAAAAAARIPDLVPKEETRALQFVREHPTYDGRQVIIGVLDTGVDPSLASLTQDGKLLDCEDCSGSGDVLLTSATATAMMMEPSNNNDTENTNNNNNSMTTIQGWQVTGLSGRTLHLPYEWNLQPFPLSSEESLVTKSNLNDSVPTLEAATANTTTTTATNNTMPVRLGIKRAYELFPRQVVQRCKAHRKREVEQAVHQYIANARLELTQLLQQSNNDSNKDDSNSNNNNSIKRKKRQQEELEARLQILNTFWEDFDDPGPVYDIVVFCSSSNGSTQLLRAVIDVTEQGGDALRSLPTLTDFHLEPHVVAVFGLVDQMKFGIHFYQNGQVVNLFCDVTPHGSHVANIATAAMVTSTSSTLSTQQQQQPPTISSDTFDDGDMTISSGLGSGVAPGAKLVSLKIGDTRLRGMETGTSLMRALIAAVHHKCHVLNISYGEGTSLPNTGRIIQMMEEVVWRHNILIVASAGNNGPALTSVGAPGGASHAILGVAAGVSQHMMKANYSMMVDDSDFNNNIGQGGEEEDEDVGKDEIVDTTYTWSAVGPMADGDWGVAVTAPGGATTRVPSWTLQKTMLMNGTSMSSPHATGCVALLLSACMAEGISFSAARIRRALINTAKPYPNLSVLQQGAGMIQVDRAWEYLQEHRDAVGEDVHFDVRVDKNNSMNGSRKPRGIYLRQQEETTARQKFGIVVDPQFPRVDANDLTDAEQERRIEFEMNFVLESTEPSWVKAPETFHLVNDSRSFAIQVDPVHLEPGVHTASVRALDASNLNRGAIFSVPITVIMTLPPMNVDCPHIFNFGQMQFEPNEVKRYFLVPPVGATWMDVTVRDCRDVRLTEESTSRLIVLHTVQLLPNHAYRDNETQKYLSLVPGQTVVTTVSVEGGVTIEVALARFWSALGKTKIDVSVEFHGIRPVPNHIRLHAGDMGAEVFLHSDFRDEWIRPSAKLTTWSTPLRPKSEGVISPVGDRLASDQRDVIPTQKKQIYQLVLNYEFTQEEKGSFTPRAPALQGVLYESAFESQIMLVFDGDKKYLGVADAWPDKITASKGTVTVRLQVRHDDPSMLEKLNDITIWIERQLDKEIELSVFGSRYDLQMGKPTISNKSLLQKGSVAGILFAGPPSSKLPVSCKAGDSIQGKAFFGSGEKILSGEGKRPRGFPFLFVVGPKMEQAASDTETQEPKDERTLEERLNEAVRDVKLEQLSKLTQKEKDDGKFEELFGQLEVEYPDHLPLFVAKLKHLDTDDKKAAEQLSRVIEAADVVIGKISDDELALHFGKLHDKENPREVQNHKVMEQKKGILVEALARKIFALLDMKEETTYAQTVEETFARLESWVEPGSNGKLSTLYIEKELRDGRSGCALKIINKLLSSDKKENGAIHPLSKSSLYRKRAAIFEMLGYRVLAACDEKMRLIASPNDYAPF